MKSEIRNPKSEINRPESLNAHRFWRSVTGVASNHCLALSILVSLLFTARAFSGASPVQAAIPQLVAEAASYRPGNNREPFRRLEELVGQSASNAALRDSLEAGLVKLLAPSSTFEARRFACKQLGIIGGKAALPALADLLKSDETAGLACLALTTYPSGKADDLLRTALGSARGNARIQIINTLGDRRDSRSVKLLAELAADSDRSVADVTIASLGKIGDKAAWDAIASLPKTASTPAITEASLRCAAGLAASGDRKTAAAAYDELLARSQPVYIRRAALEGLVRLDKDQGEQRILEVIRGSDATLKPVAIAAVRSISSRNASATFSALLPKLQPAEQVWMIESLAVRADGPARKAIAASLGSADPGVRRASIDALGRIGDVSTVALFARALGGAADAEERRAIETALIGLKSDGQIDQAIVAALKKASGSTRASLIDVIARRQGSAANILLFEEADNAEPAVARAALRALARTTLAGDVPALLRIVVAARDPDVRSEAANAASQALGKMDDVADRSALVRDALRRAPTVEDLTALLVLLPRCGDAPALAVLQAAQTDPDARVRDAAIRALADWPDASAWDALESIYRRPANDAVRGLALRGLVRMASDENAHPDSKLIERYRELLASAHSDADLRLILGALGAVAHTDALQLAVPLLAKDSVRPEAEVAVKQIAQSIKAKYPAEAEDALKKIQEKAP
jgi:HEAT repeat protein